jgi:5-methylcytosine-specific restriction endonuclease McrA
MLCKKCNGRMFIDRQYSSVDHLETFCIACGSRKFFHPPAQTGEGRWLLEKEKLLAKSTITTL